MVELIETKRKKGIFLSVLGFGTGNYKDAKMARSARGSDPFGYRIELVDLIEN